MRTPARAIIASTLALIFASCSASGTTSLPPSQRHGEPLVAAASVARDAASRSAGFDCADPALSGPWSKQRPELLYALDGSGTLYVDDRATLAPIQTLQLGSLNPLRIAVDSHQNLFVSSPASIVAFHRGCATPFKTLSVDQPFADFAVGDDDTVYALGADILIFAQGSSSQTGIIPRTFGSYDRIAVAGTNTLVVEKNIGPPTQSGVQLNVFVNGVENVAKGGSCQCTIGPMTVDSNGDIVIASSPESFPNRPYLFVGATKLPDAPATQIVASNHPGKLLELDSTSNVVRERSLTKPGLGVPLALPGVNSAVSVAVSPRRPLADLR